VNFLPQSMQERCRKERSCSLLVMGVPVVFMPFWSNSAFMWVPRVQAAAEPPAMVPEAVVPDGPAFADDAPVQRTTSTDIGDGGELADEAAQRPNYDMAERVSKLMEEFVKIVIPGKEL
jgi:hypothetical protein